MDNEMPPTDGPSPDEPPTTPAAVPLQDAAPPPGAPPYPGQAPPPGAPYYPGMIQYPEESQALLSLLMSIIGLVVCSGLLCPVGWYLGSKEIEAIDAGRRDPSKRDLAMAGKIVGIIGTALLMIGVVIMIGLLIFFIAVGAASSA